MKKISNELLELCEKEYSDKKLIVPFGKMDNNENVYMDFTNVSGLFIAGETASGKSIFVDDIILSLMHKNKSSDVQFCLIDPKEIELIEYNGLDYVMGSKSEYDIVKIESLMNDVNRIMNIREEKLTKNRFCGIDSYQTDIDIRVPHIFVIIDEGDDVLKNQNMEEICKRILNTGNQLGIHLIFSTNAYLKEYKDSKFLDLFKYRVSFDMASGEQSKFIGFKDAHWLSTNGEAIINGYNGISYRFQAPFADVSNIKDVKPYIIK